jgi:hypothetical protein
MPNFDYECDKCEKEVTCYWTHPQYEKVLAGELVSQCPHCKTELSQNKRVIGNGLKISVIGVSKGYYNSY